MLRRYHFDGAPARQSGRRLRESVLLKRVELQRGTDSPDRASLVEEPVAQIKHDLTTVLAPKLIRLGALGYQCCDVLCDQSGQLYWTDLNPRPGAIVYVYELVKRLVQQHHLYPLDTATDTPNTGVYHRSVALPAGCRTFQAVQQRLGDLLPPDGEGFVVVGNPGLIPFGSLDITAVVSRYTGDNSAVAASLWSQVDHTLSQ